MPDDAAHTDQTAQAAPATDTPAVRLQHVDPAYRHRLSGEAAIARA